MDTDRHGSQPPAHNGGWEKQLQAGETATVDKVDSSGNVRLRLKGGRHRQPLKWLRNDKLNAIKLVRQIITAATTPHKGGGEKSAESQLDGKPPTEGERLRKALTRPARNWICEVEEIRRQIGATEDKATQEELRSDLAMLKREARKDGEIVKDDPGDHTNSRERDRDDADDAAALAEMEAAADQPIVPENA
eukprot:gene7180-3864_t